MVDIDRKQKMGLLMIGAERFRPLGSDTPHGSYLHRKSLDAEAKLASCQQFADVTFPGIVCTREEVIKAIDAFVQADVDYILAFYMSWAEDFAWIRFLRDMPQIPILFSHCIAPSIELGDTSDDDEFTKYLCYGGLVGMLEASGDNARFQRPMFETMAGTWEQILDRARIFGSAAKARALLRHSTVGLLACYNEAMWSTYVNPYDMFFKVGPELRFLSISELTAKIKTIKDEDVRAVMKNLCDQHEKLDDVDNTKLFASVQASMAMEALAKDYDLDLLALNDIDTVLFREVGLRPGFWPTSDEVKTLIVPEGDLGGGLATYMLKLVGCERPNFIEPFHIDLPNDSFAAGHAGPNDYREEGGSTKIARDVRFAKTKWKHAGAPFAWHVFSPGEKTMVHVSQHSDGFVMAAHLIESMPCKHFLATYSHGLFRAKGESNAQLFENLLKMGVTQHYGMGSGDKVEELRILSRLLGFAWHEV